MKSKRVLSAMLVMTMVCCLVSGCGKSEQSEAKDDTAKGGGGNFPAKQATIICPWGVGGGADVIARKIAQVAEEHLGYPIIVENHTGASGTIGMNDAAKAPADGYTLVTANGPLFSLTPKFLDVNYELSDFTFLRGMRTVALMIITNPQKTDLKTFDDVIAYGKSEKIKYATSSGPGGDQYVVASAAFKSLGIDAEPVVFESQAEVLNAVVSGQVMMGLATPPAYYDFEEEGTAKAVATFYPEPVETPFGVIETMKSWGVEVEFAGMDCLAISSEVPEDVINKWEEILTKVYKDEEFISYMEEMGFPVWDADSTEVQNFVEKQMDSMDDYVELIK